MCLSLREERIVIGIAQAVRALGVGLELHQVDDIDHPDFQLGKVLTENGNGGQDLQGGDIAAAGHHHVGLGALIVAGPLPDADALRAVGDGGIHGQPLGGIMLAANHDD